MNKYICESKINYRSPELEPLILKQYQILRDKETQEKFVVLKYLNSISETVQAMKFEITQLSQIGTPIRKAEYVYEDFEVKGYEYFVPYGKIIIDERCESIEVKLISVSCGLWGWHNKEWSRKYDIDQIMVVNKQVAKNNQTNKPYIEITKLRKRGLHYPYWISILLSVLLVLITIASVHLFYQNRIDAAGGLFSYDEIDDDSVRITKYYGANKNITIPLRLDNKAVTQIGPNAFNGNLIKSVEINALEVEIMEFAFSNCSQLVSVKGKNISIIGQSAFYNCNNLQEVIFSNIGEIRENAFSECSKLIEFENYASMIVFSNAFENCRNLANVNLPGATIFRSAFVGNNNMTNLQFMHGNVSNLGELFGYSNDDVPQTLKNVTVGMDYINKDFFANLYQLEEVHINNLNSVVEFRAFEKCSLKNYVIINNLEILDNVLISTLPGATEIVIPNMVQDIAIKAFRGSGVTLKRLEITESSVHLTKDHFNNCYALEQLRLGPNVTADQGVFTPLRDTLISIEMPILSNNFNTLFSHKTNVVHDVSIIGNREIPEDYFNNCNFMIFYAN